MLWIVVFIVCLIAGGRICYNEATGRTIWSSKTTPFRWRNAPYHWFAGWIVAGIVAGGIVTVIAQDVTKDYVPVETPIVALNDNIGTEGSFFLGSGSIDSEAVFFYYAGDNTNGFRLKHVDADDASIIEFDGDPYMVQYCGDLSTSPSWIDFNLDKSKPSCRSWDKTVFYVPSGSIQSNYILDAE